jgi:CBS domain-containing protein
MPKVRDVMTPAAECLDAKATAVEAARLFAERDIGAMLVCDRGRVLGLITERDLVTRVLAERRPPARTRVGRIVTPVVGAVSVDDDLHSAVVTMAETRAHRMPVTEDGVLVGVLTGADVQRAQEAPDVIDLVSVEAR